ncbi:MAG: type II toxin-antitoxin system VapC family toxin [Deltaproteobacteria bacterium]|nr:type II toxin-antitoxin system VapC family toxin [Deltaproteobacteria bacterium]
MSIYADSSFFVSVYTNDVHSQAARKRAAQRFAVWLTPLHRAEWANALALAVFRRFISADQAQQARFVFARDLRSGLWVAKAFPESVFDRSADIATTYSVRLGTRTLDALHVACALELGAKEFWTFDDRQAKLAKAVGLKVV